MNGDNFCCVSSSTHTLCTFEYLAQTAVNSKFPEDELVTEERIVEYCFIQYFACLCYQKLSAIRWRCFPTISL